MSSFLSSYLGTCDRPDPRQTEFDRLEKMPRKPVKANDVVLVACGLIERGFLWQHREATVLAANEHSVLVDFGGEKVGSMTTMDHVWVHPALVVEVLYNKDDLAKELLGEVEPECAPETFRTVGDWGVDTFGGKAEPKAVALKMLGEAVELCFAAGARRGEVDAEVGLKWEKASSDAIMSGPSGPVDFITGESHALDLEAFREELADCIIVGCTGMATTGGDPEAAVTAKSKKNRARRWNVRPDGTAQHIKEEPTDGEHAE